MKNRFPAELACPAIAVLILAAGCARSAKTAVAWQLPQPVRIEGKETWGSLYPSPLSWFSAGVAGAGSGLLLRDGDLIMADSHLHVYRRSDGTKLSPVLDDWRMRLADVTVSVNLEKNEAGWSWLEKAPPRELELVRAVMVDGEVTARKRQILGRFAAANPHVALVIGSGSMAVEALPLFRPRLLYCTDGVVRKLGDFLANQPQLETLIIAGDEKSDFGVLPALPDLRRLVVIDFKSKANFPLPARLPALKTLAVIGSELLDLSALGPTLGNLEELTLGAKGLTDLGSLAACRNLKTLNLTFCEKVQNVSSLAGLKQLQWVGLPPEISQEEFAAFVAAHRDLRILEMINFQSVTSLSPLAELKSLEGLILIGKAPSLAGLKEMKSLRFVAFPADAFKDAPAEIAALQKALPDAMVVPVKPFCLGSGWVLLLLPAFAVGALAHGRAARRPARIFHTPRGFSSTSDDGRAASCRRGAGHAG